MYASRRTFGEKPKTKQPVTDKVIDVVSAIIVHPTERRVLIAKRAPTVHLGNMWELPGGKVNEGESHQTALRRELLEELDITVLCAVPVHTQYQTQNSGQKVRITTYAVLQHSGEAKLDRNVHTHHAWIVNPEKFMPRVRSLEPFIQNWFDLFNSLFRGYNVNKL